MKSSALHNVFLVGSPNSGKTTLFNWLTGRKQKVVNYPGSTVDISLGESLENLGEVVHIVDTPGTYSLFPKSQDEEVTSRALFEKSENNSGKVIAVLDSTQIARQIHLVRQLQEAGFSIVVAVTMHDLHIKEDSEVDVKKLGEILGAPVCAIDGVLGGGVRELLAAVRKLESPKNIHELPPWPLEKLQKVFNDGEKTAVSVARKELKIFDKTENLDKIFLHPVFGIFIFALVMFGLFSSIYWAATPLMDLVDAGFGLFNNLMKSLLGDGLLGRFVGDGIISGAGAVFVFVPQIFILFVGISLLEDSGYLARAAALIDKPLQKLGLNGKAFVPLLSGFACAVPAIMAARSINSKKERWIATFIIPFMTCSARLPVYALLLGFLFLDPLKAGFGLSLLYLGGILAGAISAAFLSRMVKMKSPSFFLMELPIYRRPQWRVVLRNSLKRTRSYIVKTAPIILALSVSLWVLANFPNSSERDPHLRLEKSYAAKFGQTLEPIFKPMGVDWRIGVGLISAFAARETFVASLAVMFNITETENKDTIRTSLISRMREATWPDGRPLFTLPSVISILVFFMLALQCISTSSVAFREMNSMAFVIGQVVAMNLLAYVAAVATFQLLS